MPLGGLESGNGIRKCRKCRRLPGAFFGGFFFETKFVFISCTVGLPGRARQSCCPKVPDHVKANVKQVIEGKAAPKVLKTQSDAVVIMGTKVKMASAGMAMYQGSAIQGFRSGQTMRSASPLLHSFIPAIFLRTMRMLLSLGRWCRQSRWHPQAAPPQ
jgi:hypothetical protein